MPDSKIEVELTDSRESATLPETNSVRIARVEEAQSRQDTDRVRALEIGQAVHTTQIQDHEQVLRELKDHLAAMLARFDTFERKALVVAGAFFVSSGKADHILSALGLG